MTLSECHKIELCLPVGVRLATPILVIATGVATPSIVVHDDHGGGATGREVPPSMKHIMVSLMVRCSAILAAYTRASRSSGPLKNRMVK